MAKIPQIQSQFITISGGMDLTTPPIAKANSEALIALNLQPHYNGGFSRIEGYECIDGAFVPSEMYGGHFLTQPYLNNTHIGKSIQIGEATFYILAIQNDRVTVCTVGKPIIEKGSHFNLDGVTYHLITSLFFDSGSLEESKELQSQVLQFASNKVKAVPGEGELRGIAVLDGDIIAFRDTSNEECGVFFSSSSGWQKARSSYVVTLKDITRSEDLIDGVEFSVGRNRSNILSAVLSADNSSGFIVTNIPLIENNSIVISGNNVAKVKSCEKLTLSKGLNWKIIYHNFYGSPDTQYAYAVNGEMVIEIRPHGVIIPISVNLPNPQYICAHKNHLFVGFSGGQLGHSLVGKPVKWSTLLGAEQFALGDEITALASAVGGILLIGCRYKTTALYGSTSDDWILKDISNTGIKAGTLQSIFAPIAISSNGIIRVDQTEQFGDFKLSETDTSRKLGFKPIENNIIYSSVWAKANQIRFYSKNSLHICMSFQSDGQTRCSYFIYPDRLMGVWQSPEHTFLSFDDGKVYIQNDKVNSFSGKPIEWQLKMAFNHCGSPTIIKSWKSAELQVKTEGILNFKYHFDLDYSSNFHASVLDKPIRAIGEGGIWNENYWNEFLWSSDSYSTPVLYLSGFSRNLSLSFSGKEINAPQFELTGLVLNYIPRRIYRV